MRPVGRLLLLAVLVVAAAAAAGCGGEEGAAAGEPGVRVVATTTQVADLVGHVAGPDTEVAALLAANADPHDHEVRPEDVEALAGADLVVRSGGDLDEWLLEAVEGAGSDAPVLTLIDHVEPLGGDDGVDPHWWQDPANAVRAVGAIRDALARADAAGAAGHRARAAAYERDLRRLDRAVRACIEQIPEARRKLVTTHDALGYYARRYGLDVIGTVIPSLSTQGQASAGETARLVRTIRAEGVPAVFAESSVDARVEEAIAREAGAVVGPPLWADTLGPAGSGAETYVGAVAANTRAVAEALTGGAARCELPGG